MKALTSTVAVALALALITGSTAQASVAQVGTVYNVTVTVSGVVYFWQRGSRSAQPACSAAFPGRWAFSAATPAGQSLLALILSANATGKPITVAGSSVCDVAGDTESVSYAYIDDR